MSQLAVDTTSTTDQSPSETPGPHAPGVKPHLVIEPESGWAALNLAEVWNFRDLLLTLALRDLKLRYKQTALGAIWVVLQPLLAAGIFSFVFGVVASLPSDGVPYFLFSYAGLLGWNLFSGTLSKTSGCLVGNSHLISKVFFPRLVLPLSSVPSTLVDFSVAIVMAGVLMILWAIVPGPALLLLPVASILAITLALGIGLITASLAVTYRDINYILPVFLQMVLYISPIAYATSAIPDRWQTIYHLNPLVPILETFRYALLGVGQFSPAWLAYSTAWAIALFVIGAFSFKRMERSFADVI
jgi:lipopolysaccharide transport system permease protein